MTWLERLRRDIEAGESPERLREPQGPYAPWGSFAPQHGRMQFVTPLELDDVGRLEAAQAMARRAQRVRALVLGGLFLVVAALLGALLSGCGVDLDLDSSAPPHPQVDHVVSQGFALENRSGELVAWRFAWSAGVWGLAVAPGDEGSAYLDCIEGELVCWATEPEHAYEQPCVPCGRGTVVLRAEP